MRKRTDLESRLRIGFVVTARYVKVFMCGGDPFAACDASSASVPRRSVPSMSNLAHLVLGSVAEVDGFGNVRTWGISSSRYDVATSLGGYGALAGACIKNSITESSLAF